MPGEAGATEFIPYGRQEMDREDVEAVVAALTDELITQGPRIAEFEHALADHVGAAHAVAFSSGTAALHGAAHVAGLGPGREAITTPITFAASANCVLYTGARPRFVDIDPATWNLDTEAAAAAIDERTEAVIAVSYAGLPVDLSPLARRPPGVAIVEDAAHALGAVRGGIPVGGCDVADMATFSFHPVKALTTGEGGAVVTDDAALAERLRTFRTHGITRAQTTPGPTDGDWYYEMQDLGFNYRITDFQCALGASQLARLDGWIERRNEIAARYRELLADDRRVDLPPSAPGGWLHAYHLFPIRVRAGAVARLRAFRALRAAGIGVQVHYIPVYQLPYYRDRLGYPQDGCPHAEELYAGLMSLPMFPGLEDRDLERVVAELGKALR